MRCFVSAAACAAFLATAGVACAQAGPNPLDPHRFALGVTAGSDGAGAELAYAATPWLVLRARGTWLEFNYKGDSGALRYNGRFKLSEFGGFADLHPFSNPLMLSVGAVTGARRVDLSARAREAITYRGVPFSIAEIGTIGGRAQLSDPAPFVGLGYDDTFTTRRRIGLKLVLGVVFSHAPDVSLTPQSGLAAEFPAALNLAKLASDIRRDGDVLKTYPAISAGASYRF